MAPSSEFGQSWKAGRGTARPARYGLGFIIVVCGLVAVGIIEVVRVRLHHGPVNDVLVASLFAFVLGPLAAILFYKWRKQRKMQKGPES